VPILGGCGTPTPTRTPTPTVTPAAGLDFSLGIDTNGDSADDCGTRPSQSTSCHLPPGATFRLNTYLDGFPLVLPGYVGFDLVVDYAGITSHDNADADVWPDCGFEAFFFSSAQTAWGCAVGIGTPLSTFTGVVGTLDFTCTANGSVELDHQDGGTGVTGGPAHDSYREAGPDALTIFCDVPPPTGTPSATPTAASVGGIAFDTGAGGEDLALDGAIALAGLLLGGALLSVAGWRASHRRDNRMCT
jgi:hypothetical protein